MRLDGTIRYRGFEGAITGKLFLTFFKQTLFPVLPKERNLFYRQILWSIMKIFLRNWKIRVVKLLRNSVKVAIFRIVISVCQGWFFLRVTDFFFESRYRSGKRGEGESSMIFENKIAELLTSNGLKQAALCRLTGIPTFLMSNYVKWKVSPTLNNAIKIADALA